LKIAIIPARGGSKRIPRKNIRDFCGKPMIAYAIDVAKASGLFDQIVVSTDDEEIARIARQYGAKTPFVRPAELADDHTNTVDVIKHAIQYFIDRQYSLEAVCCIYATVPFLKVQDLQQGYQQLIQESCDYAFSVTTFPFPVQRALQILDNGRLDAVWPEYRMTRSQDLEEYYHDAGQFYWGRPDAFLQDKIVFSECSTPVILPRYRVQDIDTPEDWERASYMYQALTLQEKDNEQ